MKNIYFITPDISEPTGGIKVIYKFVSMLNGLGYNAYIVHKQRKFKCQYAKHLSNLKFIYLENGQIFTEEDVIFVPEPDAVLMNEMKDMTAQKYVFNQNWGYTFGQFRAMKNSKIVKYQDMNFFNVMCVTGVIKDFLDFSMNDSKNLNIDVVNPFISDNFRPINLADKNHQIAFMPRKNFFIFQEIYSTLFAKEGENITWVKIDGANEEQVAEVMRRSTIFLAMGFPEGFSLPPLEAMASGCVVIGYSGQGGKEYMIDARGDGPDANMFLFPDGDVINLSKKLHQIWKDIKEGKNMDDYQSIANNGIKTAARFNYENTLLQLESYAKKHFA